MNESDKFFFTAARNGNISQLSTLLTEVSNINTIERALIIASSDNQIDAVQFLIEHGANIEATDHEQSTSLFIACQKGYNQIALFLINKGANLEHKNKHGDTPLTIATWNNKFTVVKLLLDAGADLNSTNFRNKSALYLAREKNLPEIAKLIKSRMPAISEDEKKILYTKTQAVIRSFFTRKRFLINPLSFIQQTNGGVFAHGNDPEINELSQFKKSERIGIVATSGVRVLSIAAGLTSPESRSPKIFLLDISYKVINYWKNIKITFENCTGDLFLRDLTREIENSLETISKMYSSSPVAAERIAKQKAACEEYVLFFQSLFSIHGYEKIQKIARNVHVIPQNWADKNSFEKIKNIFSELGITNICAYPSNIVPCLESKNQIVEMHAVLNNIKLLNPFLAIHTNIDLERACPTKVYYVEDNQPEQVLELLNLNKSAMMSGFTMS